MANEDLIACCCQKNILSWEKGRATCFLCVFFPEISEATFFNLVGFFIFFWNGSKLFWKRDSPIFRKHPSFWISIDQIYRVSMTKVFGTILAHSGTWTLKLMVGKCLEEEFLFNYGDFWVSMFVPTDWKPTPRNNIFSKYPKWFNLRNISVFNLAGCLSSGV